MHGSGVPVKAGPPGQSSKESKGGKGLGFRG